MTRITVRVDDHDKQIAMQILDDIGLTMTDAINIFLKAIIRENDIPFEYQEDPFYSDRNMQRLIEAKSQIEALNKAKENFPH